MKQCNLLIAIVSANPNIVVQSSNMQDIVRDVWRETGTIIGAKQQNDYYDHPFQSDRDGEPRQMFRINRRKFSLTIKS